MEIIRQSFLHFGDAPAELFIVSKVAELNYTEVANEGRGGYPTAPLQAFSSLQPDQGLRYHAADWLSPQSWGGRRKRAED